MVVKKSVKNTKFFICTGLVLSIIFFINGSLGNPVKKLKFEICLLIFYRLNSKCFQNVVPGRM